ncbi:Vesicle-mediated ER to Golgi transport protein [Boothiomyces sp. JEL0866]|nr:Vesicle-mediated ER to Golgi transport protein [Boothiomyces sp. JEL0866]KAJ3319492.1 Vesicle-mediated ER to Golgi transport protein [Boothiomyces sp. JEL0866]KAJ3320969.1 Vesicle-mediated ER to Golgi transport protein [Boothiomyces sp. JEL0866]
MDFLFGKAEKVAPDASSTIDKLCDRVRDSTLLEDRRSAVQGLRGLARDWQVQVGTKGMPALITVLQNDRMDVEIIKLTLETLNILCSTNGEDEMGKTLTEIFVKDPQNISLLLDILAEVDFYVRFNCVQLITTLFNNVGNALHEGILTSPLGISRLIDLLDDRREIIRNGKLFLILDGLLLLISLTANNADIQKIVAFENAFERLFSIIVDEGSVDGDIIVQDCLQLMHNLLKHNASNQNLFRETSCIKMIPRLLVFKDPSGQTYSVAQNKEELSEQKIANITSVLALIRILVEGNNQNTTINQNLFGQSNMVATLFELGMTTHMPLNIRIQALLAVGDVIKLHEVNRDRFSKCTAKMSIQAEHSGLPNQKPPPGTLTQSAMALVQTAMEKNPFALRSAATYAFRCFIEDNMEGQIAISTSLKPSSNSETGSLIISNLLDLSTARKDPWVLWFASNMLLHSLHRNPHSQDLALSVIFQEHGESISLIHKVCYTLLCAGRDGLDAKVQIALLSLLSVWLYENPKVVKEFLSEGSNIQYLVEQINHASGIDPVIQGLAAFLYGLVFEFNDDSEAAFTRANLQNVVSSRIGVDIFLSKVQRLKEAKYYLSNDDDLDNPFDPVFLEFLKLYLDQITRSVTVYKARAISSKPKPTENGNESQAKISSLMKALQDKDTEIAQLQQELEQLKYVKRSPSPHPPNSSREMEFLRHQLKEKDDKVKEIEAEQEDLLLCLADQEIEIQNLKERLKKYGEVFEDDE